MLACALPCLNLGVAGADFWELEGGEGSTILYPSGIRRTLKLPREGEEGLRGTEEGASCFPIAHFVTCDKNRYAWF